MKRSASTLILMMVFFSLASVGVSMAQAQDPYFRNPNSPPGPPPTSSVSPTPGDSVLPTIHPDPDCSIPMPSAARVDCPGIDDGGIDGGLNGGGTGNDDEVLGKDLENDKGLGNKLPEERGATVPDAGTLGGALPFTGAQIGLVLIVGLMALGVGFLLVRRSRSTDH